MAAPIVIPKARFFDANGDPLPGGKVFSFIAGTSTPKATFTDSTAATPNANPTILDANGEADIWLVGNYKIELRDADDVVQWVVDNVKETLTSVGGAFTLVSSSPTVNSPTQFELTGDFTTDFFANQRIRFETSSTTVHTRVTSANFSGGITTVNTESGDISVGTPTGVFKGLGDTGFPIDARHVAFGTSDNVDNQLQGLGSVAQTDLDTNSGLRIAIGQLSSHIGGLVDQAVVDPALDEVAFYDSSADATSKADIDDFLKASVQALADLGLGVDNADELMIVDSSVGALRRINVGNLVSESVSISTSELIQDDGYIVFSNGLVMQWGNVDSGGFSGTEVIPLEMPNTLFTVVCTVFRNSASPGSDEEIRVHSFTTTGFSWHHIQGTGIFKYIVIGD